MIDLEKVLMNIVRPLCSDGDSVVVKQMESLNDNELLLTAGTGICMINGSEDTKKCADYVSERSNNQDGCAYDIDKYVLKRPV